MNFTHLKEKLYNHMPAYASCPRKVISALILTYVTCMLQAKQKETSEAAETIAAGSGIVISPLAAKLFLKPQLLNRALE